MKNIKKISALFIVVASLFSATVSFAGNIHGGIYDCGADVVVRK